MLAALAALEGAIVAWHYHRLGLTLTHYDARGHLVVARRIADSITPGWQQIGAVWLPLPHLLNAIPVQIDLLYRTGASAVVISIVSFAVTVGAIAWIVMTLTESAAAGVAATVVLALNPNVLYLQSTPLTEPLLLALSTVGIALLIADRRRDAGIVLALACLTRYEAWPVAATALAAMVWVLRRRGRPFASAVRDSAAIGVYPIAAILAFLAFSHIVIGQWFVSDGFFVPENKALGDRMMAAAEIGWGARTVSSDWLVAAGALGMFVMLLWGLTRRRAEAILPLALVTMAAVPWVAFASGHPFRIRYAVPLMTLEAIGAGIAAGLAGYGVTRTRLWRPLRPVGALAIVAIALYDLRPLDRAAPMVAEAQWDSPNVTARDRVTACLPAPGSGEPIMASMGSLGHYMQDASRSGYTLRDFLHEGNGDIWIAALQDPRPYAPWMLVEEKAQGGDMLAHIARDRPTFRDGYERVCDAAGMALYRRRDGQEGQDGQDGSQRH